MFKPVSSGVYRCKWWNPLVPLCVAVGVVLTGSSKVWSADLSRDAALTKLSMAFKLPRTIFADLPSRFVVMDLEGLPLIEDLQSKGLLTAKPITGPGIVFPTYEIQLTEAGNKWLAPTNAPANSDKGGSGKAYRVAICDLAMHSVTGIRLSADKSKAEVHFNLKVSNVSGFARLSPRSQCYGVLIGKGEGPTKDLTPGVVNMALFDDGWRVMPSR